MSYASDALIDALERDNAKLRKALDVLITCANRHDCIGYDVDGNITTCKYLTDRDGEFCKLDVMCRELGIDRWREEE